jgi:mannose/fructose/N-acetylgalactosamine-specific phosphotransferase system component IIC
VAKPASYAVTVCAVPVSEAGATLRFTATTARLVLSHKDCSGIENGDFTLSA